MDDLEGLGLPETGVTLTCFRCGQGHRPDIESEERTFSIAVSLEEPMADGSIDVKECSAICQLCFDCAGVMLAEAVMNKGLTMPPPMPEEDE